MTSGASVAVVYLGRPGALGLHRRVESWLSIASAAGCRAHPVDVAALRGRPEPSRLRGLLTGDLVPEALTWSRAGLREALQALSPELVVFVTARAFDARCVPAQARVVLDFVDVISDNYRMRCNRNASPLRRAAYASLAGSMRRFERAQHGDVRRAAAGWRDAQQLGASWVPNVHRIPSQAAAETGTARHDLLFHGTLSYEPNVEALLHFRAAWQELRRQRPHVTMLVAGARPSGRTAAAITAVPGWTLLPDFPSLSAVMSQARVAVAPLVCATGFQNKVLETAAHGLPQVVSPAAQRGLDPDFPVLVAETVQQWSQTLSGLLDDPAAARALGDRARDHVHEHYRPERFGSWLCDGEDWGSRTATSTDRPQSTSSPAALVGRTTVSCSIDGTSAVGSRT
jgi:hypothetical protein